MLIRKLRALYHGTVFTVFSAIPEKTMLPDLLPQSPNQPVHQIGEASPLRLHAVRGRRIDCLAGVLWITVSGEAEDFYLSAGESLVVPTHGLVLVGTLSPVPATMCLLPPLSVSLSLSLWSAVRVRLAGFSQLPGSQTLGAR